MINYWFVAHWTHCELSNSWISFSRSLKQPSEQIELRMSVSTAEIDGMTWKRGEDVKATSAVSWFISFAYQRLHNLHHRQLQLQFALATGCHPRVSVDLRKLQQFSWIFQLHLFESRRPLTVNRFSGLTSIIPRKRFWQSGGTKCGMWKTPRLTFSSSCLKLSSSNGKAPTNKAGRGEKKNRLWKKFARKGSDAPYHTR